MFHLSEQSWLPALVRAVVAACSCQCSHDCLHLPLQSWLPALGRAVSHDCSEKCRQSWLLTRPGSHDYFEKRMQQWLLRQLQVAMTALASANNIDRFDECKQPWLLWNVQVVIIVLTCARGHGCSDKGRHSWLLWQVQATMTALKRGCSHDCSCKCRQPWLLWKVHAGTAALTCTGDQRVWLHWRTDTMSAISGIQLYENWIIAHMSQPIPWLITLKTTVTGSRFTGDAVAMEIIIWHYVTVNYFWCHWGRSFMIDRWSWSLKKMKTKNLIMKLLIT